MAGPKLPVLRFGLRVSVSARSRALVRAAPEIAKGIAAVGAAIPFTGIVKGMLGPAEMWRDRVRMYRYEKQLKCVEKAERMALDVGFIPRAVSPKLLFPLLEGVSLEEHEDLHTMWAALLANASSPDFAEQVRPGYRGKYVSMVNGDGAWTNGPL